MKILIVKTSALGDIIHVFPVISYLRNKFPKAQIDWVVEAPFAELVQSHPDINRVICVKTRAWRKSPFTQQHWQEMQAFRKKLRDVEYDVIFDLQGNIKSGLITVQAKSKHKVGFGRTSVPEWPNMLFTNHRYNPPKGKNIREDYLFLVCTYFGDPLPSSEKTNCLLTISPEQHTAIETIMQQFPSNAQKIMVCPGSAWPNKQMTSEALIAFLQMLQTSRQCHFLILWGSPQEKLVAQTLCEQLPGHSSVADRLPLQVLQNLMGKMDLVIAMDSLPLHLAGTAGTRSFGIFGPSSAVKYGPEGPQHHTLQGGCPYGRTFEKRCPILRTCATGQCIRGLTGQQVFQVFSSVDCKIKTN